MKYEIMFYGGLVIAIITLILAIITFLKLNVAEAICDLVGINFKGNKKYKKNEVKKEKIKYSGLSRSITRSIKYTNSAQIELAKNNANKERSNNINPKEVIKNDLYLEKDTELINTNLAIDDEEKTNILYEDNTELTYGESTRLLVDNEDTDIIEDENTSLLDEENTTMLDEDNTTLLEDEEATTILDEEATTIICDDLEETMLIEDDNGFSDEFIKEVDIVLINSRNII